MTNQCELAVIGGGIAGLTAAWNAAGRGAQVTLFEESGRFGGLVANIGVLDDYPAPGTLAGASLADALLLRCAGMHVAIDNSRVESLSGHDGNWKLHTARGMTAARAVLVASGARLRKLGVPGEAELAGKGVSQCDWCDGSLYRNQAVAVVGGGDAALQAALHLASMCASVAIIARSATLRARRAYVERAADNERIGFFWETAVEAINGECGVESLALRSLPDGASSEYPCRGVFIFAGIEPNTGFLPAAVRRDANGMIVTDARGCASMPGLFAAGAVRSGYSGALASAAGDGTAAASAAVAGINREPPA